MLLAVAGLSRVVFADELTNDDKYFLAGYEKMRAALVADDLVKANKAASELSAEGFEVPKSETLERARAGVCERERDCDQGGRRVIPAITWCIVRS